MTSSLKRSKLKAEKFTSMINSGHSQAEIEKALKITPVEYLDELTNLQNSISEFLDITVSVAHVSRLMYVVKSMHDNIERQKNMVLRTEKIAKLHPDKPQYALAASKMNATLNKLLSDTFLFTIHSPLAISFDRFIKEHINSSSARRNKGILPLLPEDLPGHDNDEAKIQAKKTLDDFKNRLAKGEITQEKYDAIKEYFDKMEEYYNKIKQSYAEEYQCIQSNSF